MAVTTTVSPPLPSPEARPKVEPLESGDQLTAGEFLRRYEEMPEVKKAELIEGIVCRIRRMPRSSSNSRQKGGPGK